MANLPEQTLQTIFSLQYQLFQLINQASAIEAMITDQFGETEITNSTLEELQNARERVTMPYSRLCTLLLRIAEAQPIASNAMIDLLIQTIAQGEAAIAASTASIQEVKRDLNIL